MDKMEWAEIVLKEGRVILCRECAKRIAKEDKYVMDGTMMYCSEKCRDSFE